MLILATEFPKEMFCFTQNEWNPPSVGPDMMYCREVLEQSWSEMPDMYLFPSFCPIRKIQIVNLLRQLCDVGSPVREENLPLAKQSKRLSVRKQAPGACSPEQAGSERVMVLRVCLMGEPSMRPLVL